MNKNEFMNKVTEMVMGDPSMRESLKKLYEELSQIPGIVCQKPGGAFYRHSPQWYHLS